MDSEGYLVSGRMNGAWCMGCVSDTRWLMESEEHAHGFMGAFAFPSLTLWVRPMVAEFLARPRYALRSPCLRCHCAYCSPYGAMLPFAFCSS
jgi:hypothetical protein